MASSCHGPITTTRCGNGSPRSCRSSNRPACASRTGKGAANDERRASADRPASATDLMKTVRTPVLDIAYEESGPADGRPVVLMHGFPDDIHAYDGVAPPLADYGYRVIVPYLRGYGPTRFLDPATPRSGQQAALGHDLRDLI